METVQTEGGRKVTRHTEYYNLDLVLSIGYRVNSVRAAAFRQWATKTLKQYIIEGYAVNKNRIAKNYRQFAQIIEDIKLLLPPGELIKTGDVLELISLYADTWVSLDAYDRGEFEPKQLTRRSVDLTAQELSQALAELKANLIAKSQAAELFGMEQNPEKLTSPALTALTILVAQSSPKDKERVIKLVTTLQS
ncbi:MAG: RhuM [Candidatus Roizmanbacteria bacterium GW2011_GWC2_41_7]|nr:MAG: RhuM [Candidatus Roizmanbacteria bacterium GW2011_GWC2_41_7]